LTDAGSADGLRALLETEYATTAEVATSLEAVEAYCLPRRDRRGIFCTAYLRITSALEAELETAGFRDPDWVARYLVCFANLYRRALLAYEVGDRPAVPKAWRIAFDAARDGTGLVIQHLVLGINAHINHDLAVALGAVGIDPDRATRYADHTRVNEVLGRATAELKESVGTMYAPLLNRLDRVAGSLDDQLTAFSIPKARDHAWTFAVAITGSRSGAERALLRRALNDQAAVLARVILSRPTRHPWLLRGVRVLERLDAAARRLFG
jgi:hypothetical protein